MPGHGNGSGYGHGYGVWQAGGDVHGSHFTHRTHNVPMDPDAHKDRSIGLVVFGVIEIAIGVFCALLIPLVLAVVLAAQSVAGFTADLDARTMVPSLAVYGLAAVIFIWLGIGSIRARRWAAAVMLSLSWLWLITGAVAMVSLWLLMPRLQDLAGMAELPGGAMTVALVTTSLLLGFMYVLLPLAFVLFYRSPHVTATCRARDPGPSWVDGCPSPIVSLVVVYGLGAASLLVVPAYGFLFPLFGVVLAGWSGAAAWLLVLALLAYLIMGTARRDPTAWTVAMAASILAACSSTVTVAVVPWSVWLARLSLPGQQPQLAEILGEPSSLVMVLGSLAVWGSWIAYLLYVRRFFHAPQDPTREGR